MDKNKSRHVLYDMNINWWPSMHKHGYINFGADIQYSNIAGGLLNSNVCVALKRAVWVLVHYTVSFPEEKGEYCWLCLRVLFVWVTRVNTNDPAVKLVQVNEARILASYKLCLHGLTPPQTDQLSVKHTTRVLTSSTVCVRLSTPF